MNSKMMKRAVVLILAILMVLPTCTFAVSTPTVTVRNGNNTIVPSGATISADETLVFTFPNAITNIQNVTFYEQSKYATTKNNMNKYWANAEDLTQVSDTNLGISVTPWYPRAFNGELSNDGTVLTVQFKDGDLSANSSYKFSFDLDGVSTTIEDEFVFATTMANHLYMSENFERYTGTEFIPWSQGSDNAMYNDLMPFARLAGWDGAYMGRDSAAAKIVAESGKKYLSIEFNNGRSYYYNNGYVGVLPNNSTEHIGKTTISFKVGSTENVLLELAGIGILQTSDTVWDIFIRDTAAANYSNSAYSAEEWTKIGTHTFATASTSSTEHTLSFITKSSGHTNGAMTKTFYSVTLDGTTYNANGVTLSTSHGKHIGVFHRTSTNGTPDGLSSGAFIYSMKTATESTGSSILIDSMKYEDVRGAADIITSSDNLCRTDDSITVQFEDAPKAGTGTTVTEELLSQITITKVSDNSNVLWGTDGYDAETNSITITPSQRLEHNAQYKVTVPARDYTLIGAGAALEKTFTTGWEKLEAETTETTVTSQNFAPSVTVENITGASLAYATKLALYKVDGELIQQVAVADTVQTALGIGESATISVGTVSDPNPSNSASYYAKIYFIEGADAVAQPIVIGTAPAVTAPFFDNAVSTVTFTPDPDPDTGRIDVQGQYVGGLPERSLWVSVADKNGKVVYNDQFSGGNTGCFKFGFNLLPGATTADGDYTVSVKPSDGTSFTGVVNMNFDTVLPAVVSLNITGTPQYKGILTVSYTLFDFIERDDASLIEWKTKGAEDADYTTVKSVTITGTDDDLTYTVSADDVGKHLICVVTPKVRTSVGTANGIPFASNIDASPVIEPLYLASVPEVTSAVLSQTSGQNKVGLTYSVSDPANHTPGVHQVKWEISSDAGITWNDIQNDMFDFYAVTSGDAGKLIRAKVTPVVILPEYDEDETERDIAVGASTVSNVLTMSYTATQIEDSGSSGGGGGGGFGVPVLGGGNTEREVAAPIYQPTEEGALSGAIDFPDVRGHWAEKEIFELYDSGIVTGRTEHEFDPDGQITRAEFVAILVRALKLPQSTYAGSFADVSGDEWFADVLQTAKENGLFDGSEGNAYPNRSITREEMAVLIVRAYEKFCGEIVVGGGILDFEDSTAISVWARESVGKAKFVKLVNGTGDGQFAPLANTTRAECAVITTRLILNVDKALAAQKAEAEAKAAAEKAAEEAAKKAEADAIAQEQAQKEAEEQKALEDAKAQEDAEAAGYGPRNDDDEEE